MIVIQGAGITGLTLAGLLQKAGMEYTIVEQSESLHPIGAGIVLQRNALEVLAGLPEGDLGACSTAIERMELGSDTEPGLQSMKLDQATRSRGIHRGDLQQFLLQQIDPSCLRLATSITTWHQGADGLELSLTTGEQLRAKVLVGADGISSSVRSALSGAPMVRDSGQWCARTVITGQPFGPTAQEVHAGRYRLGVVPLAAGRTYIFWVRSRHDRTPLTVGEINTSMQALGAVGQTLAGHLMPTQSWLQHPLLDIPISWGKGPVVLLGDAAHALTPNLGQGAALGIEDAYVLANLLRRGDTTREPLAQQLRQLRHSRVRNVRVASYVMGKVAHVEGSWLRGIRNRLLKTSSAARSRKALAQWLDQFSLAMRISM